MENAGGLHRYSKHARPTYEAVFPGRSVANVTGNSATVNRIVPAVAAASIGDQNRQREQDQYMPIANVIRIMRRILPSHAKISDDAKETIQECVSEYISFVTSEANERCHQEQRKTITADDILWAMGKLGFDNHVEPLSLFLQKYREMERDGNVTSGSVRGMGESVLKRGLDYGGPVTMPPTLPAFNIGGGGGGGFLGIYDPPPQMVGGYYRDVSGLDSDGSVQHNGSSGYDGFDAGGRNKIEHFGYK